MSHPYAPLTDEQLTQRIRRGLARWSDKWRYLATRRATHRALWRLGHLPGPRADLATRHLSEVFDELDRCLQHTEQLVGDIFSADYTAYESLKRLRARGGEARHKAMLRVADTGEVHPDDAVWLLEQSLASDNPPTTRRVDARALLLRLLPVDDDPVLTARLLGCGVETATSSLRDQLGDDQPMCRAIVELFSQTRFKPDLVAAAERITAMSADERDTLLALAAGWDGNLDELFDTADLVTDGVLDHA